MEAYGNAFSSFLKLWRLRAGLDLVPVTLPSELERLRDFDSVNLDVFRRVLAEATTRVNRWGGRLVFVYLPHWDRYGSRRLSPGAARRDRVLEIVRAQGIPVVDMHQVFQATRDPLALFPFRQSGHYNEEGHRLVAEEVLRALPNWLTGWPAIPDPGSSESGLVAGGEGAAK